MWDYTQKWRDLWSLWIQPCLLKGSVTGVWWRDSGGLAVPSETVFGLEPEGFWKSNQMEMMDRSKFKSPRLPRYLWLLSGNGMVKHCGTLVKHLYLPRKASGNLQKIFSNSAMTVPTDFLWIFSGMNRIIFKIAWMIWNAKCQFTVHMVCIFVWFRVYPRFF